MAQLQSAPRPQQEAAPSEAVKPAAAKVQALTPKAEQERDPALQAKLDKVKDLMPKTHTEIGGKDDKAYAYMKTQVETFIKSRTPALNEQLDLLTAELRSGGGFDPASFQKKMLEFQTRTQNGEPGFLPANVEAVYQLWKKTDAELKPGSDMRKSMDAIDKKLAPELVTAYTREQYTKLFEKMHQIENPPKK